MAGKNYKDIAGGDLCIDDMVYSRITFLPKTDTNDIAVARYIVEAMYELNLCFNIAEDSLGDETNYKGTQKSIVADVASVYLLMRKAVGVTAGVADGATEGSSDGRILTATTAGSVEVEFEQADIRKGGIAMHSGELMQQFKDAARRKARGLGCELAWDNDDLQVDLQRYRDKAPFIFVSCNNDY